MLASTGSFDNLVHEELQKVAKRLTTEHQRIVAAASSHFGDEVVLSGLSMRPRSSRLGAVAAAATGETPAGDSSTIAGGMELDQQVSGLPLPEGIGADSPDPQSLTTSRAPGTRRFSTRSGRSGSGPAPRAGPKDGQEPEDAAAARISAVEQEVTRLQATLRALHELLDSRLPAAAPPAAAHSALGVGAADASGCGGGVALQRPTITAARFGEATTEPASKAPNTLLQSLRQKRMSKLGRKSVLWGTGVRFEDESADSVPAGPGCGGTASEVGDPILPRDPSHPKGKGGIAAARTPTLDTAIGRLNVPTDPWERFRENETTSECSFQSGRKRASACSQRRRSGTSEASLPATTASSAVCAAFELLPHWSQELRREKMTRGNNTQSNIWSSNGDAAYGDEGAATKTRWVLGPTSVPRLAWDSVGTTLITYDLFTVPLGFLKFQDTPFTITMTWVTRLFWTFDIGASFLTGYTLETGELTLRLSHIAWRYMRTWFVIDLLLVGMDWMHELTILADSTGRVMRMLRIFRMMRLVRLARMMFVMQITSERIRSEKAATLANIAMIVALILGVTHVIACMWFALGDEYSNGWVKAGGFQEEDRWLQYAISLHWSLTQFTGTMDLEPQNLPERFFAVATLLFAFVIASWFVSSITSSMTRLHIISRKQSVQFSMLRRFLFENGISQRLMARLQRNARHALALRSRHLAECDVELLGIVAEPLRVELHFEIHWPKLEIHPLFSRYGRESPEAVRRLCHMAVNALVFERGDVLFDAGEVPLKRRMLFPWEGALNYTRQIPGDVTPTLSECSEEEQAPPRNGRRLTRHSLLSAATLLSNVTIDTAHPGTLGHQVSSEQETKMDRVVIGPGLWLCEPVLWTQWTYRGHLQACSDCQLMAIDGLLFEEVAAQTPCFDLARYAVLFIRELNEAGSKLTDVGSFPGAMSLISRSYGSSRRQTHETRTQFSSVGPSFSPPSASAPHGRRS